MSLSKAREMRLARRAGGNKRGSVAQAGAAAPGSSNTPALEAPTLSSLQAQGIVVTAHDSDSAESKSILKLVNGKVVPDGRVCLLCSVKDSETDYVYSHRSIIWAYPPTADCKNSGMAPG